MPNYITISINSMESQVVRASYNQTDGLSVDKVCSFQVKMIRRDNIYYWDIYDLVSQIKNSVVKCIEKFDEKPDYIAFNCWAHDFALLDESGEIIDLPMAHNTFVDSTIMNSVLSRVSKDEIYNITGNSFNAFNTIYQLAYLKRYKPEVIDRAKSLLFMPDLLVYMLTGEMCTELTYATTSQLFNLAERRWDSRLFDTIGVDISIMQEVVDPGTKIFSVRESVKSQLHLDDLKVVVGVTNDLSASVMSFAEEGSNWAVLFSRTWAIMGINLNHPILSEQAQEMNFTNSPTYGNGNYCLQRSFYGLGLLSRFMDSCGNVEIINRGIDSEHPSFKYLLDMRSPEIIEPNDTLGSIQNIFIKRGDTPPYTFQEVETCIYESIGYMCRYTLDHIKLFAPEFIERIYIGDLGADNSRLCQTVADATGITVYAGNSLSSAIGSIIVQLIATNEVDSLATAREIVAKSIGYTVYKPKNRTLWDENYFSNFLEVIN